MSSSAIISIVVPTHSRWEFLRRTLAGALAQTGVEAEVVVVDDGSTDETPLRLAEIDDPRLRTIRTERPGGVARARNRGVEAAAGSGSPSSTTTTSGPPTSCADSSTPRRPPAPPSPTPPR